MTLARALADLGCFITLNQAPLGITLQLGIVYTLLKYGNTFTTECSRSNTSDSTYHQAYTSGMGICALFSRAFVAEIYIIV